MTLEAARREYEALVKEVRRHNHLYYDQDAPELSDYEYDALTQRLKQLEEEFPELVTSDSPTQQIGGTVSAKFDKVQHTVRMESLQDVFDFDEVRDFDRRVREAVSLLLTWWNVKLTAFPSAWNIAQEPSCAVRRAETAS